MKCAWNHTIIRFIRWNVDNCLISETSVSHFGKSAYSACKVTSISSQSLNPADSENNWTETEYSTNPCTEKFQWYDKVIPQSRRNNLSHLVKRKHLCSDWSFTDMYFLDYESLNMHIWSMLAHISFEIWTHLDRSLLIITWQGYHTSGQLYSSLFRYWSITYDLKRKIGMDANNFKSPFVHAMTSMPGNKPSPESLLTNVIVAFTRQWVNTSKENQFQFHQNHYSDVTISAMAS